MPRAIRTLYTVEDLHARNMRFTGEYPEMVTYFVERFDPERETLLDFLTRQKPSHDRFLAKRGWSQEAIDSMWAGIITLLVSKRQVVAFRTHTRRKRHVIQKGNKWVIVES